MRFWAITLYIPLVCLLAGGNRAGAIDFYLTPDTTLSQPGQVVVLTGQIGPSELMRGFTVYLSYDTNLIDLAMPPTAGALIAGRVGLQFNYFDHPAFEPNVLEIGGTIFGTDLWSGPGELFQARFTVRTCGDAPVTAPFNPFFVDANGGYPAVQFEGAAVLICDRIPAPPAALTVAPVSESAVTLRWRTTRLDVLGRPLLTAPEYRIFRREVLPNAGAWVTIATVADTVFVDGANVDSYEYFIQAITEP